MSQLSVQDQREVDSLNDDIRRLTQQNKEAFSSRMRYEAEKNKLENLLTNNLNRRHDELVQVGCPKPYPQIADTSFSFHKSIWLKNQILFLYL